MLNPSLWRVNICRFWVCDNELKGPTIVFVYQCSTSASSNCPGSIDAASTSIPSVNTHTGNLLREPLQVISPTINYSQPSMWQSPKISTCFDLLKSETKGIILRRLSNPNLRTTRTFKLGFVFFRSDAGHVKRLRRLRQHPLQPIQRGLALLRQSRQTLLAGVERWYVAVAVF